MGYCFWNRTQRHDKACQSCLITFVDFIFNFNLLLQHTHATLSLLSYSLFFLFILIIHGDQNSAPRYRLDSIHPEETRRSETTMALLSYCPFPLIHTLINSSFLLFIFILILHMSDVQAGDPFEAWSLFSGLARASNMAKSRRQIVLYIFPLLPFSLLLVSSLFFSMEELRYTYIALTGCNNV